MATFLIRFYGRFVFAEPKNGGAVRALAIDPSYVTELGLARHHLLLSARHADVSADGTRQANFAVMPPFDQSPSRLEQRVWSLDGCDLGLPTSGGISWMAKAMLPDLAMLTNGGAILDTDFPYATSVIEIPSGTLTGMRMGTARAYEFVPFSNTAGPGQFDTPAVADVVEWRFEASSDLQIDVAPRNRIPSARQTVVLKGSDREPVTATLSHMCAAGSHRAYDAEFAALYLALKNPPKLEDRLIPRAAPAFWETPCLAPAYIQF